MGIRVTGLLVAGIWTAAMVLGACGGGGDDAGGDAGATATTAHATPTPATGATTDAGDGDDVAIDACALVSVDDAEAALEAEVSEPEHEDVPPQFYGCRYDSPAGPVLTVAVVAFESAEVAESFIDSVIETNSYERVEGIGDQAYNTQPIGDLSVRKGKYELSIDIYGLGEDDAELSAAKALAEKALERLP